MRNPVRYLNSSRQGVLALRLTVATYQAIFEWSPGKPFYGPAPKGGSMPITGYTVFTAAGRVKAEYGDWIVRDRDDNFSVVSPTVFEQEYRTVDLSLGGDR